MLWLNEELTWQRDAWAVKVGAEQALSGVVTAAEALSISKTIQEGTDLARRSNAARRESKVLGDAARGERSLY